MTDSYSVLYIGRLKPDVDVEQAADALAARFNTDPRKIRNMFQAGREVKLKSGLNAEQAGWYRRVLEDIGLVVRTEPPIDDPVEQAPQPAGTGSDHASDSFRDPFVPPRANLEQGNEVGGFHEPVSVPASHGWRWIREGFAMVFASPVSWIGAVLVWTILNIVFNLIPLVNLVAGLTVPVFLGGIMMGAREQDEGGRFTVGHVFAAFSNRFGALLLVGVLFTVGTLALLMAAFMVMGGMLAAMAGLSSAEPEIVAGLATNPMMWLPILVAAALMLPLLMAFWFAATLVALDDISALSAMGMSFRACLRNVLPFLVYGLIGLVLTMLGSIPLGLGLLIVMPGLIASVYTGYRDIFRG